MENINNPAIRVLESDELNMVSGGGHGHVIFKTPTWKYVDGTPQWAIDAAMAIGYEVEKLPS